MSYCTRILGLVVICTVGAAAPALLSTALAEAEQPFGDDQIEIKVGEPFTITRSPDDFKYIPNYRSFDLRAYHFVTLNQIARERLFVSISANPDAAIAEDKVNRVAVWTEDGGQSWGKPVLFRGKQSGGHSFIRRKDGTCFWPSYFTRPIDEKTVSFNYGLSKDGKTFTWHVGKVSFPKAVPPWKEGAAYIVISRSIVEMDDAALLATMYGRFQGDADKTFRCVLVRSVDGGATWKYLSTIGYDPALDWGFTEPCMVRLDNGELLCVMRDRSGQPMYQARSKDNGRTFSPPKQMPQYAVSVFPDIVQMTNGVVAVASGRPGDHLIFSVDGGHRWTRRTTIFPGNSDGYPAIREVQPGRLLYVYQETAQGKSLIRGVHVDVRCK